MFEEIEKNSDQKRAKLQQGNPLSHNVNYSADRSFVILHISLYYSYIDFHWLSWREFYQEHIWQ